MLHFREKNYLKSGNFSLLKKCVFLGTSPCHVQVYHSCLKKYFSNSTKFLDKHFMKYKFFRFLARAFQCIRNRNSLFSLKKWLNMLKIDFLCCRGNGQVVKNTYWFYLRIKMFCISIFTILLLKVKVLDYVNFITHNLN